MFFSFTTFTKHTVRSLGEVNGCFQFKKMQFYFEQTPYEQNKRITKII